MPCFLTQSIQVDLSKVDKTFVNEALKGLEGVKHFLPGEGYTVVNLEDGASVTFSNGKLNITSLSRTRAKEIENAVKRGISTNVLQAASKKFRWQLKSGAKQDEYVVEKRGF